MYSLHAGIHCVPWADPKHQLASVDHCRDRDTISVYTLLRELVPVSSDAHRDDEEDDDDCSDDSDDDCNDDNNCGDDDGDNDDDCNDDNDTDDAGNDNEDEQSDESECAHALQSI